MISLHPVRAFVEDAHHALLERASARCDARVATLPRAMDDASGREQARALVGVLGAERLLEPIFPLDLRGCVVMREVLARVSPLADEVFALQALGTLPIFWRGSAALIERYARPALAGAMMAAFAMTEPEAGSDVASLTTSARRDGDTYVLHGSKTLISNAGIADFYVVFAKTDAAAGSRGISCFVVPSDAPGLHFTRAQVLSAPHPLGELSFAECRVPADHLLGAEGEGFKIGMSTLDAVRTTVGAAATGMASRALEEALAHVASRKQFGAALAEQQLVQSRLAIMAVELDAARLLVYRAAHERDDGAERVTLESAMAKLFATEAAQRIIDSALQLFGGRGVLAESVVDGLYRSIRPLRIYEGATDVQYIVIARALLRGRG